MHHCLHCGSEPELRKNEQFFMFICPGCRNLGGVHLSEHVAAIWWDRLNEPQRPCLNCGSQPKMRYFKDEDSWSFMCVGCGFFPLPIMDLQAALTSWHRQNYAGDIEFEHLWVKRYWQIYPENKNEKTISQSISR